MSSREAGALRSRAPGAHPREFHPADVLDNEWKPELQPQEGCGLVNLGNTCFLNSVVQCLVGTPTLMNLLSGKHSHTALCAAEDLEQDWYQTFERSLLKMINSPGGRLRPIPFTNKVTEVIKSHRPGEQEDAHEYLVNLLEKLHQYAMDAYMKIHDLDKEWLKKNRHLELTSSVNQIFAGLIRSQVLCKTCGSPSNTFDPFTDLSLELHECHRVCDCLQHFTAVETLGHSNAYFCDTCQRKSTATKQLTIHTLPNILVIQLKRFSFAGSLGGKISRHIAFETELDMGKFLSRKAGAGETDNMYDLYGVLVHKGSSAQCGHYYSYVKYKGGRWYKLDDDKADVVTNINQVLMEHAYILFYARRVPRQESLIAPLIGEGGILSPKVLSPQGLSPSRGCVGGLQDSLCRALIGPAMPPSSGAGAQDGGSGGFIGPTVPDVPAPETVAMGPGLAGVGEYEGLDGAKQGSAGAGRPSPNSNEGGDEDALEAALDRHFSSGVVHQAMNGAQQDLNANVSGREVSPDQGGTGPSAPANGVVHPAMNGTQQDLNDADADAHTSPKYRPTCTSPSVSRQRDGERDVRVHGEGHRGRDRDRPREKRERSRGGSHERRMGDHDAAGAARWDPSGAFTAEFEQALQSCVSGGDVARLRICLSMFGRMCQVLDSSLRRAEWPSKVAKKVKGVMESDSAASETELVHVVTSDRQPFWAEAARTIDSDCKRDLLDAGSAQMRALGRRPRDY